jgi:hypothetical protein
MAEVQDINAHADWLFRLGDHGTDAVGHDYSRKVLAAKIDAVAAKIDALAQKVDAGLHISFDPGKFTPDQLTLLGSVMAGRMVIDGIAAKNGRITLTLEAAGA